MSSDWSPEELTAIATADELEIATVRSDGTRRRATPIWVVQVGAEVHVRTWHRRDTGWFGDAISTHRAHVRVPGVEADVTIDDIGADDQTRRAEGDAAYRSKYGRYGHDTIERMATDDAAAATLRLVPER